MFTVEYEGINSFLVGMSKVLLNESICRETRGKKVWELPEPIIIKITNPLSRIITIPERNWNCFLSYAESLWLASGQNHMKMIEYYLNNLKDYSDDGEYMRAGYGPRLRSFNGNSLDYRKNEICEKGSFQYSEIDQFQFIILKFLEDPFTRQAIITIGDPSKDCFDENNILKKTKDFPCTRSIHFMRNAGKPQLDLYVHFRSNDFLWGAGGVNIFNYTFMQEYFSKILNLEIGDYYHIVNNLHYYDEFKKKIELLTTIEDFIDESFIYESSFSSLEEFDSNVKRIMIWENQIRENKTKEMLKFKDDFFNDWSLVFYKKHFPKKKITFTNPILNKLIGNK